MRLAAPANGIESKVGSQAFSKSGAHRSHTSYRTHKSYLHTRRPILAALLALFSVADAAPPNILFFLVDDLGQRDLGTYGSTFYETPHLDRLAREGAKFTDAYAACPVCSPTRASIMTGLWPQRTGITDFIAPNNSNGPEKWNRNTPLLPAPNRDRLALDTPTLAKALKAAGYATFFAGKWHLGPEGYWPENQGFEINRGGNERGGPYGGGKYFSPYGNSRLTDGPEGEHLPDRLATETAKFIRANRNRPFFAYFSVGNQGGAPGSAVRRGNWKLIEWMEDQRTELFDLSRDAGEQTNLANQEPQRVAALRAELQGWRSRIGAIFPTPNPKFNPAKPSGRAADRPTADVPAPAEKQPTTKKRKAK